MLISLHKQELKSINDLAIKEYEKIKMNKEKKKFSKVFFAVVLINTLLLPGYLSVT